MEFQMKMFIPTFLAALTLVGGTLLAAERPTTVSETAVGCVPGIAATAPGVCSLPGFHWEQTIVYVGHHDDPRAGWMLLRNK
jgi:hypothetical protein